MIDFGLATDTEIPFQKEILTAEGTDPSAMQYLMGIGNHIAMIPCRARYILSTAETCAIKDVEASISLTAEVMKALKNNSVL